MREQTYRITTSREGEIEIAVDGAGGRTSVLARVDGPQALIEWLARRLGGDASGPLAEADRLRAERVRWTAACERAASDARDERRERERAWTQLARATRQLVDAKVRMALAGVVPTPGHNAYDQVLAYAHEVARENARLRERLGEREEAT